MLISSLEFNCFEPEIQVEQIGCRLKQIFSFGGSRTHGCQQELTWMQEESTSTQQDALFMILIKNQNNIYSSNVPRQSVYGKTYSIGGI